MIFVTGASGLIGFCICRELERSALQYVYAGRERLPSLRGKFIRWDLSTEPFESVSARLPIPSVIVHCAAATPSSTEVCTESVAVSNRIIDANIGACAARSSARVIFMSTTAVYGSLGGQVVCEADALPLSHLSHYALEKSISERMFLDLDPCNTVLRINAPYGARQRQLTVLRRFILNALAGRNIEVFSRGVRRQDFTHVSDIARLAVNVVRSEEGGVFNISTGKPVSMLELARLVICTVGSASTRVILSDRVDPQEHFRANFDTHLAQEKIGWTPLVPLTEGITECVKELRG